jgi:hypothetical protein
LIGKTIPTLQLQIAVGFGVRFHQDVLARGTFETMFVIGKPGEFHSGGDNSFLAHRADRIVFDFSGMLLTPNGSVHFMYFPFFTEVGMADGTGQTMGMKELAIIQLTLFFHDKLSTHLTAVAKVGPVIFHAKNVDTITLHRVIR